MNNTSSGLLRRWQSRTIGAKKNRGYSLLELMISTTLGLVIMAGVVQMYVSSRTTQTAISGTSRVQENARYIFERFERDIGRAGLMGCRPPWFQPPSFDPAGNTTQMLNMLGKGAASTYDFSQAVGGLEGTGLLGSDELVIRFVSSSGLPILANMDGPGGTNSVIQVNDTDPFYRNFEQWQIAVLADCEYAAIFIITNDPQTSGGVIQMALNTPAPSNNAINPDQYNKCDFESTTSGCKQLLNVTTGKRYSFSPLPDAANPMLISDTFGWGQTAMLYSGTSVGVFSYEIGDSAAGACTAAEPQYCALLVNGAELVDGVEDFQVLYGVQGAANTLAYLDASAVTDWSVVNSIQLAITLNSVDTAGMDKATNGLYKQTFTRTFHLYNQP